MDITLYLQINSDINKVALSFYDKRRMTMNELRPLCVFFLPGHTSINMSSLASQRRTF